ncbi:hypothetical protein ACP8HI_18680 [Paenibacillus sp. FA6]|uniref:hypothetical protein n=1 Tax=Paenibacillus sp. FA6 TaxID=3413029 RepID=UPI003F659936
MFQDLNTRLANVKEKGRSHLKWEKRLEGLKSELSNMVAEELKWEQRLNDEVQDVERLTSMSLANLIYSIIGKKEEKLKREQLEVIEAKVKYDEALRAVKDITIQIQHVQQELSALRGWRIEYDEIMKVKEEHMLRGNRELMELMNEQADLTVTLKELKEAIQAGNLVVNSLESAMDALKTAGNWGTYDLLGGGMISTHLKHSNIDKAMGYVHDAQSELGAFARELKDVQMSLSVEIEIGDFLKFSDYFFDGFISDWMVQGRINDTLTQVENKMDAVEKLINLLANLLANQFASLESDLAASKSQYTRMIEQAE